MSALNRGYTMVSAAVFTLVAVVQAWRAVAGFPIEIDHHLLPGAASWGVAAVAAGMAVWGWRSR